MKMSWKNAQRNHVVEAGQYHVVVKGWKEHTSKTGNECVIFDLEIIGPVDSPEVGQKVGDFITLTEAAAWKLGWFVGSCGVDTTTLPDMDTGTEAFQRILNLCIGRKMWVQVAKEVFDNKDVNKVTDYVPDEDQEEIIDIEEVPDFIKSKMNRTADQNREAGQEG